VEEYEEKIKEYLRKNAVAAEHLSFNQSCHNVEETARVVNAAADEFVKNICLIGPQNELSSQ